MSKSVKKNQVYVSTVDSSLKIHVLRVKRNGDIVAENNRDGKTVTYDVNQFDSYWKLTDDVFTRVIFRRDQMGEIFACLVDVPCNRYNIAVYAHIGQHSEASRLYAIVASRVTNAADYIDLKKELESIGYFVKVIRAFPYFDDTTYSESKGMYI